MEQRPLLHLGVVVIEKGAKVANFTLPYLFPDEINIQCNCITSKSTQIKTVQFKILLRACVCACVNKRERERERERKREREVGKDKFISYQITHKSKSYYYKYCHGWVYGCGGEVV